MHFGEYELFPSLISLSPLPTAHPRTFQRSLVRSSSAVLPAPSTWPWVDHKVSRLPPLTIAPYSDSLSLRLRAS